jgi:hypothetical protein
MLATRDAAIIAALSLLMLPCFFFATLILMPLFACHDITSFTR